MNRKKLKTLRGINKISSRYHLGGKSISNIAYSMVEGKTKCSLLDISDPKERVELAERTLNDVHNDPHSSSLTNNHLSEPVVDLQIIMPVYNTEQFLDDCIQSVLNQETKYSWSLVIINDGSPDGSAEILKKYENHNSIKIISQENKGLSGARNAGIKDIYGRYVAFLDSDDMFAPDAVENWMNAAYKYDADIVDGGFFRRTTDGKLYGKFVHKSQESCSGFMCSKIFRANLFRNIQFPEKYWFEDTMYAFLIEPFAKIRTISEVVYYYTANPNSICHTHSGKPKCLDAFYVVRALVNDCVNFQGIDFHNIDAVNNILRHFQIIWHRTHILGKDIEEAIFVLSCDLWHKYYCCDIEASDELKSMQKAMSEFNFDLYRRECLFM